MLFSGLSLLWTLCPASVSGYLLQIYFDAVAAAFLSVTVLEVRGLWMLQLSPLFSGGLLNISRRTDHITV